MEALGFICYRQLFSKAGSQRRPLGLPKARHTEDKCGSWDLAWTGTWHQLSRGAIKTQTSPHCCLIKKGHFPASLSKGQTPANVLPGRSAGQDGGPAEFSSWGSEGRPGHHSSPELPLSNHGSPTSGTVCLLTPALQPCSPAALQPCSDGIVGDLVS